MPFQKLTIKERLERYSCYTGDCIVWTGATCTTGYGQLGVDGKNRMVHRLAFMEAGGYIPPKFQIDHLCRNKLCINPAHLEAVTQYENDRRAGLRGMGLRNTKKTHCPQGHAYDEANTYLSPSAGRLCRTCQQAHSKRYLQQKRQAA